MENVVTILNENVTHISLWEQIVNILPFVASLVVFAFGIHLIRYTIALISFRKDLRNFENMYDDYTEESRDEITEDIIKKYGKYRFFKRYTKGTL